MRRSDRDIIRALPLFRDVSDSHFEELVSAAFLQRFPQHVVLIREGELPDFLHVVVDGIVELFSNYDDRETTIDVIRPVTTFILAAVIRDKVYLKSARTLAPASILMIPAKVVRDVFDRDAAFARAIVSELAERYRGVVHALKNQKLRTSAERLANWILASDQKQGGTGRVVLDYDKRTLALQLGMTPENLSRSLTILAKHGVEGHGRELIIDNPDALRRWAKPDPLIDG